MRKFAFLVDAGSYTRAAQELNVSQPALSSAIAKLETELHAKLLVRGVRPIKLTPAGKLAYGAAKALIACTTNLSTHLAALRQERSSLSVGMIDSVADILFADTPLLPGLDSDTKVSTIVDDSRSLLRGIEQDELDVAFIAEQPRKLSDLFKTRFVATEPLVPVIHRDLAGGLQPGTLPRFVGYDQSSTTFQLVLEALRKRRIDTEPIGYSASPDMILRLLLSHKGSAVLPYILVRDLLENGTLQLVGGRRPLLIGRRIAMARRRDKDAPVSLTKLRHQLADSLDELMAEARAHLGKTSYI